MKALLLLCTMTFFTTYETFGQKVFEWAEYGLSFDLADDFKETANTSEEFSAEGDGMSVSIIPFKDGSIDDQDITAYTIDAAASLNISAIDDVNTINLNGFKGGYAEVVSDGHKVFIMGLIDPGSDVNFFIIITFADGDVLATEEAIAICNGLHKM